MAETLKKRAPKLVTFTLVVVAVTAAYALYWRYTDRPWTRDGQVRADIIKVAPRVEGYITRVAVTNNQLVRKSRLLFEIDPSDYQLAVDKAQVSLDQAREDVEALEAAVRAAAATVKQRHAAVTSAEGKVEEGPSRHHIRASCRDHQQRRLGQNESRSGPVWRGQCANSTGQSRA